MKLVNQNQNNASEKTEDSGKQSKQDLRAEISSDQQKIIKTGGLLSKSNQDTLDKLLSSAVGGQIELLYRQLGTQYFGEGYEYPQIIIDSKSAPHHEIRVAGRIEMVSFRLPGKPENKDKTKEWADKLGNIHFTNTYEDEAGKLIEDVYITPKVAIADKQSKTPQESPIKLDLTYYGLGVLDSAWKQRVIPVGGYIGGNKEYCINLDTESITLEDINNGVCAALATGSNTAERLFGVKAGSLVKNIVIFESEAEEAMFFPSAPNAIFIGDNILHSGSKQLVALNEATHLIDYHYKISDGSFKEFALKLLSSKEGKDFIITMREDKFLPGVKDMGHSPDEGEYQYQELFGAFVASLQHPKLEEKLKSLSAKDKELYAELCKITLNRLDVISLNKSEIGEVFAPQILIQKISGAIKFLSEVKA